MRGIRIFAALLGPMVCGWRVCGGDVETNTALRIELRSPVEYQVVQRTTRMEGKLVVDGSVIAEREGAAAPDTLEVRIIGSGKSSAGEANNGWHKLDFNAAVSPERRRAWTFGGEVMAPTGGWYCIKVRALCKGIEAGSATVDHVGVGEVFVVAGQSNSANYGEERQTNRTRLVAAFDGKGWRLADDPQPGAGGARGSFMPEFGDAMAERFGVPIGIVAMGIGSTSVREWLPRGTRLTRPPTLTRNVTSVGPGQWETMGRIFDNFTARMRELGANGFRAVLWHQGESDAHQADEEHTLPGDLYRQYLEQLIRDSRRKIGWNAPWFVAQVSYHNPKDTGSADIRAAQKALWDTGVALEGPDTDTLTGNMREKNGQGVHLSGKGLKEHGRLWAEKVGPWLEHELGKSTQ